MTGEMTGGIEFHHNEKLCVVRPGAWPGRCNGYVAWPERKHYDDMMGSEEPTFAGRLRGQGEQWFIGFDTGHVTDTDASSGLHEVIERTKLFAETLKTVQWSVKPGRLARLVRKLFRRC